MKLNRLALPLAAMLGCAPGGTDAEDPPEATGLIRCSCDQTYACDDDCGTCDPDCSDPNAPPPETAKPKPEPVVEVCAFGGYQSFSMAMTQENYNWLGGCDPIVTENLIEVKFGSATYLYEAERDVVTMEAKLDLANPNREVRVVLTATTSDGIERFEGGFESDGSTNRGILVHYAHLLSVRADEVLACGETATFDYRVRVTSDDGWGCTVITKMLPR